MIWKWFCYCWTARNLISPFVYLRLSYSKVRYSPSLKRTKWHMLKLVSYLCHTDQNHNCKERENNYVYIIKFELAAHYTKLLPNGSLKHSKWSMFLTWKEEYGHLIILYEYVCACGWELNLSNKNVFCLKRRYLKVQMFLWFHTWYDYLV